MQAAVSDINAHRGAKGRKDASGQEKVVEMEVLRERESELGRLLLAKRDASEAFNDAVKATAEKSGLMASVVRKFIVARAKDDTDDAKRAADQLALCFEEI